LDALHIGSPPSLPIYFSIEKDIIIFQDPPPNIVLRKGDLLWANSDHSQGGIVKHNSELLARFQPPNPGHDFGLDAIYIWPSGEIWFSTEEGFTDAQLGPITPGDLLSDHGYIVYHNLELLQAFAPMEDLAHFGFDSLAVISDAVVSDTAGARLQIEFQNQKTRILIKWTGAGRVFQLERSASVTGPYSPIAPITTDSQFEDVGPFPPNEDRFYRLQQW
jgi:hypothetical protein